MANLNQNKEISKSFISRDYTDYFHLSYPGAFSAVDMYVVVSLPDGSVRTIGNLAALSISTHRDTFPVSSMPYINPRGFTQGHRTIAGTMMFHTIDRNAFGYSAINEPRRKYTVRGGNQLGPTQADELPLFDVHINYVNEEGGASLESLLGVRTLDFGKTMSLENLHPIESYSYMALDYSPMFPIVNGDQAANLFILNRLGNRDPRQIRTAEESRFSAIIDDIFQDFPDVQS
jgi:hypothetical protein